MTMLDNKLFADYESNHIVMTYPSMHAELEYYKKLLASDIFVDGDIFNWTCHNYDNRLSFYNADPNSSSNSKTPDYHPTPIMYYNWLNNFIVPKLNIELDFQFTTKMQTAIENINDYNKLGSCIQQTGYDINKNWQRGY